MNDLFVRKSHSMVKAHGKKHGVICLQGTNSLEDCILLSCGYKDDGRLRVWDFLERSTIAECPNLRGEEMDTIYNINTIVFLDRGNAEQLHLLKDAEENHSKMI